MKHDTYWLLFLLFSLSDYCIVAIQNATLNFLIIFGLSESLLCKSLLQAQESHGWDQLALEHLEAVADRYDHT